jgi:adenosylhomocysteinase
MRQVIRHALWMVHLLTKSAELPADQKQAKVRVELLPKKLDEEVAAAMVAGFGGVLTTLTAEQAKYLGVPVEGPFKPESYKY